MSVEPTSKGAVRRVTMAGLAAGLAGTVSAVGAIVPVGVVGISFGVVGAASGLSGCAASASEGGPGPVSERTAAEPGQVVRRTADVLVRSGTSKTRTSMVMENGGSRVTIRGKGMFDFGRRHGWLQITLPSTARTVQGPITELVVPGALYMRNRGPQIPEGKWVRVDTNSLADGNLVTGGATDPITAAALLRGARDVKRVGTEELRGVKVTHFRGTADMARAAEEATETSRGALRAATKSFTETRVPFDAYFDERGRLRKVRQEFRFHSAGGDESQRHRVKVVSTTELYDFNVGNVNFTVPEDADIYDGKIVSPAASTASR